MKLIDLAASGAPAGFACVAAVGFFDGVHVGHRYLIEQVKAHARSLNLPSAVITFPVHPRKVLQRDYQPALLCGYDEKVEQLATTGIDYCVSIPFTLALSRLSASEFMEEVLHRQIGVNTLLIGYDHRFGHNRDAGFEDYVRYGEALGMTVIQATEFQAGEEDVSSSKIRLLLKDGHIREANRLLSYPYTLSGKIVEGYQVGRTIGFPTANMKAWERFKVIPRLGVYAVLVHLKELVYEGMLYIGTRPTIHNDNEISVEVNIFGFSGNLYNQSLTVEFVDFVRSDEKFDTLEELAAQIARDKTAVQEVLATRRQ